MSAISFEILNRSTSLTTRRARAGVLKTPHGDIETPAFTPVGTKANVKGILPEQLKTLGAQVVLANTYHLYLAPGEKVVEQAGGLAKFMNWKGPTLTDSGGFQVFSLGAAFGKKLSKITRLNLVENEAVHTASIYDPEMASQPRRSSNEVGAPTGASGHGKPAVIDEEGVTFTSHLDGSLHRFTPERSVEIQHALGADLFFAFDECTAPTEPYEYQKEAMERTHRWAERSLNHHRRLSATSSKLQAVFGIVQGGRHEDLRRESARLVASLGFDGIGIGGSFSKEDMQGALQAAVGELPPELPKHFLGIGEPGDLLEGIAQGMDLFDCVAPTRIGRHGSIYTKRGIVHLKGERHRSDFSPLDPETPVIGVEGFTRAYVSHLVRSGEMLGSVICSMHNLGFILQLVAGARQAILDGRFEEYRDTFVRSYYG